jgi:hypothetical protein
VGKFHPAIAITMAMIDQNQACRFFPATAMVQLLQKAKASHEMSDLIQKLDRHFTLETDNGRSANYEFDGGRNEVGEGVCSANS